MSLELLKAIQEAEGRADVTRGNAQREAREMIKAVEAACTEHERQAAQDHRALFQSVLEEKRVQVQKALEGQSQEQEKQRIALCHDAEKRLDLAAARIFERVVNNGHR